jgi:molecular chaperone DnaK
LNDAEVEQMVKDAQKFAAEDQKRRDRVEARNAADNAVYTAEKTLRDLGDKVPADIKNDVEAKATALKGILESADTDELKRRAEELSQSLQRIGAAMYEQPQPGGPSTPPPAEGGKGDEDVVDGEFSKN